MTHGGYGNSLEWATSCPPPRHNFTIIPRIRSGRLASGLHYPHIQTGRTRKPVPSVSTPPSV
jgi:cytochrome c oxidase subunit 1